ncbi:extracellular solute-binding protein [Paenibacillus eucommiae]|uniref:Multiple sugar transport system substrate-binding protein n=1 Tax=Paenibacillus eucommiae TaxID=1355755 RepID=A0ABS4J9Z8_9BACL|nr:extracellular solute-binding protein [Paenibacillus eucommiae]MBP1996672.1 multiple sugar transport system substrate-binding protein [Paenibacillus eucommiae]
MRAGSKKYAKFLNEIKLRIISGELKEGDFIPSENKISQHYGLSRPTVRKAIAELAMEGLIQTIPGKGSVILKTLHLELNVILLNLFWYLPSNEFPVIQMIVERFNKEHRHIQIRLITFTHSITPSIYASYRNINLHEQTPDLISLTNRFLHELNSEQMESILTPLTDLDMGTKEEVYRFLWKSNMKNEALFAVPITFSPVMLVFNKEIFDRAGLDYPNNCWTWSDFLDAASKLTERESESNAQYGFAFSPSFYRWPLFFLQEGGCFVQDDLAFPPLKEGNAGIQFILDLIYKHKVTPFLFRNSALSEQLFQRGKVGMIMSTYYFSESFMKNSFEWGICKFPGGTLDKSLAISTNVGISRECRHVDEARYFLEYLISEPIQAFIKANSTTIPALQQIAESTEFPPDAFSASSGSGYYSFMDTLHDVQVVNDLGLTYKQVADLSHALEMVWCRTDSFDQVWEHLNKIWIQPQLRR